jgi:hypothetical protein
MFKADNELLSRKLLEKEFLKLTADGSPQSFVASLQKRHDRRSLDDDMDDDVTAVIVEFLTQSRKTRSRKNLDSNGTIPSISNLSAILKKWTRPRRSS